MTEQEQLNEIQNAILNVWNQKIYKEYFLIKNEIFDLCRKTLKNPIFEINPNIKSKLGSWNPKTRTIMISLNLLRNYDWNAVKYVLRHETAHQIVSEIFAMDCYGVLHGEAFKRACEMLNIDASRTYSDDRFKNYKGKNDKEDIFINKIKKIVIHANDKGATEAEAETFMLKARELMIKYNITLKDIENKNKIFIKRPFGKIYKRFPSWLNSLAYILETHYNVNTIIISEYKGFEVYKRLELFGEVSNLDIAEYIGHALLIQGEYLYTQFKRNHKKINYGRISKTSYLTGVFDGYERKLSENYNKAISKIEKEQGIIVPAYNKKLLEEMYNKSYNVRSVTTSKFRGNGYYHGTKIGENLTISKGLHGKSKKSNSMLMV